MSTDVGQDLGGLGLRPLLERVAADPHRWDSIPGREAFARIKRVVAGHELRFRRVAGDLGGIAVADVWMALDKWLDSDRVVEPEAVLHRHSRRRTAAAAAASQTGIGSPTTPGIVALAKTIRVVDVEAAERAAVPPIDQPATPSWAKALGALLVRAGWSWPIPATRAVLAAAEAAAHSARRSRSTLAAMPHLGVPPATWSALELLVLGSGPGCRTEHFWPGAWALARRGGLQAVRESTEVSRLVAAAVAGRPVRTGREFRVAVR